jgi:transcription initiation factor TFIIIB Brf1 subunit/transcription initiation factor TFIIB
MPDKPFSDSELTSRSANSESQDWLNKLSEFETSHDEVKQETSSLAEKPKDQDIAVNNPDTVVASTKEVRKPGRLSKSKLEALLKKFIDLSNKYGTNIATKHLQLNNTMFSNLMKTCGENKIYFKTPEITNICSFVELPSNVSTTFPTFTQDQLVKYRIEGDTLIVTPFSI